MIGLIISGHGHFATGLLSAVEVIAGSQDKMAAIDFPSGDTSENLHDKIAAAMQELSCESVLILTDVSGGTPFNQSVLLANEASCKCRVMSGTNMPSLLEAVFGRACDDVDALAQNLLNSEQTKLLLYADKARPRAQAQRQGGI